MSTVNAFRFASSAQWRGGDGVSATAPGKPLLRIGAPPELRGRVAGVWSPEELLVGAAASCLAITLHGIARARGVEAERIDVDGVGHVERAPEGGFHFVGIELRVEFEAVDEHPHVVQALVEEAERRCIVGRALDVPVTVDLVLATAAGVALSG